MPHLWGQAVWQLGLNFADTLPELFGGTEMGEDAIRVLNEYLTLSARIRADVRTELPHVREAVKWVGRRAGTTPRRAAFTPLHQPHCGRPPGFPGAPEHRTLKRNKFRVPVRACLERIDVQAGRLPRTAFAAVEEKAAASIRVHLRLKKLSRALRSFAAMVSCEFVPIRQGLLVCRANRLEFSLQAVPVREPAKA